MTFEEIDERYHDAALDDDGEGWEKDDAEGGVGWDDPADAEDLEDDLDEEDPDA